MGCLFQPKKFPLTVVKFSNKIIDQPGDYPLPLLALYLLCCNWEEKGVGFPLICFHIEAKGFYKEKEIKRKKNQGKSCCGHSYPTHYVDNSL